MIKNRFRRIIIFLKFIGFNPLVLYLNLKGLSFYYRDLRELKRQKGDNKLFKFGMKYPILNERNEEGGIMSGHYFHQDLHVARLIYKNNPKKHVDIGSRTDGFVAHVASFREIELIDIREIESNVKNIKFKQADLMNMPSDMEAYCDSISSLHAIEHFGLGRYNDPIDYFGYKKALENISKILKPKGVFYFSVPIGPQRIEFNAHRVFSVQYLIDILTKHLEIQSFSYVDDKGDFYENVELTESLVSTNFNCNYGCGIFELKKL